jgi:hypothetical protein
MGERAEDVAQISSLSGARPQRFELPTLRFLVGRARHRLDRASIDHAEDHAANALTPPIFLGECGEFAFRPRLEISLSH